MNVWHLTRSLLGQEEQQNVIIKVDPVWGFSEFPPPGDTKKHLLPVLNDPDDLAAVEETAEEKVDAKPAKEFWMPDKYCKVCYGCEEPFTMFRRRHHCRMCGQVFCNTCSSYSIDGDPGSGQVRSCRLCYEQALERTELENKQIRRKLLEKSAVELQQSHKAMRDLSTEFNKSHANLQRRASAHLAEIVNRLVDSSPHLPNAIKDPWKETILTMVRGVVESVDPDVRNGDELDIRPYVKIKVIPGGDISECSYVDGIVFRKNVSHKKMATTHGKENPRILLLAGGIEFQRADTKLSSMDTLIEQEDKYMELLVEKIMSLHPDIIMVGKSVARKAQELLCEHHVVVMQNVKLKLLERLSRVTGALLLPSTDNMIKQYGDECLGTCGHFKLRLVQDDPEKSTKEHVQRILRTRISRASTYAYVQGCPAERGCTIVLRGDLRSTLKEVKRILRFSVLVAYHLRLEVAYYNDRFADLPATIDDLPMDYDDASDDDDEVMDGRPENKSVLAIADGNQKLANFYDKNPAVFSRIERYYLSMSMDVDVLTPRRHELFGAPPIRYKPVTAFNIEQHQALLITSVLMGESAAAATAVQKSPADVKAIQFYTPRDVALGKFLIEHCFQLHRGFVRESKMLDQTLSFVHRFGRIDISVRRDRHTALVTEETAHRDPLRLPIHIASYCRECQKTVTPPHVISDEVWKMSFGKFLELSYYNRSARCAVGGCRHILRDCHLLSFMAEGYMAVFEFVPIHPYTLIVRNCMSFPDDFYAKQVSSTFSMLPGMHMTLMDDFRSAITVLEREIKDILGARPEDMSLAMTDVRMIETELDISTVQFLEQLAKSVEYFLQRYPQHRENEIQLQLMLQDRLTKHRNTLSQIADKDNKERESMGTSAHHMPSISTDLEAATGGLEGVGNFFVLRPTSESQYEYSTVEGPHPSAAGAGGNNSIVETSFHGTPFTPRTAFLFPYVHYRDTYLRASRWNTRIDTIYKFLDSVRSMMAQQLQAAALQASMHNANSSLADDIYEIDPILLPPASSSRKPALQQEGAHDVSPPVSSPSVVGTVSVDGVNNQGIPMLATAVPDSHIHPTPDNLSIAHHVSTASSMSVVNVGGHAPVVVNANLLDHSAMHNLGITSLYRAVQEQNRKNTMEKPNDKMSKITKALSRFLAGNKDNNEDSQKFFVPLGDFGNGRFGLKPGRDGIVIPVTEDNHASIIAYSLASQEYYDNLQASIREDHIDHGGDFDGADEFVSNPSAPSNNTSNISKQPFGVKNPLHRSGSNTSNDRNTQPLQADPNSTSSASGAVTPKLGTIREEHDDDDDAEEEDEELSPNGNTSGNNSNNPLRNSRRRHLSGAANNDHTNNSCSKHNQYALSELLANQSESERARDEEGGLSGFTSDNDGMLAFNDGTNKVIIDGVSSDKMPASSAASSTEAGPKLRVDKPGANAGRAVHDGSSHASSVQAASNAHVLSTASSTTPTSYASHPHTNKPGERVADSNEKQLMSQDKSNIRIRFDDVDDRGTLLCKFSCQIYWAKQFEALRTCYFRDTHDSTYGSSNTGNSNEARENYLRSLALSARWSAQGGKSGAAFSKTMDDRMVVKVISRVELQMFLDFAPAYFEYMAKAYYQYLPTVLCKILGVYTVRYDNKDSGRKVSENIVVMENIFYQRSITKTFDLKGSSRARYVELHDTRQKDDLFFDTATAKRRRVRRKLRRRQWKEEQKQLKQLQQASSPGTPTMPTKHLAQRRPTAAADPVYAGLYGDDDDSDVEDVDGKGNWRASKIPQVLMDDNLMEFTRGRPFPMKPKAKYFFKLAVDNDTLFLSIVNVVDYSILIGFDDDKQEMVVGIIDYLRQYDIVKKMERVGKGGVGMLTGQADPTIIPPPQYRKRFSLAMERYFMTVPDKWIAYDNKAHGGAGAASAGSFQVPQQQIALLPMVAPAQPPTTTTQAPQASEAQEKK